MKCFYHDGDFDGICSGAIVKDRYPECELIGIDYGYPFPWASLSDPLETVFMVDFSLSISEMITLNELVDLRFIDHHKSIIEKVKKSGVKFKGMLRIGKGACALTWEYFYGPEGDPDGHPVSILYISEHDVWDHSDPNTWPFQYGLGSVESALDPEDPIWPELFYGGKRNEIIELGKAIQSYVLSDYKKYADDNSFEVTWEGLNFIAINRLNVGSQVLDSVFNPSKHDACLVFGWYAKIGEWKVSIFNHGFKEELDLSKIAEKHGGGGHKNAAGFQCAKLPFELKRKVG